jgi:hypothetical protein
MCENVPNKHVHFGLADKGMKKVSPWGCLEKTSNTSGCAGRFSVRVIDRISAYFEVLCKVLATASYDLLLQCF